MKKYRVELVVGGKVLYGRNNEIVGLVQNETCSIEVLASFDNEGDALNFLEAYHNYELDNFVVRVACN